MVTFFSWYRLIDEHTAEIPLGGRRGQGKTTLVDVAKLPEIAKHSRRWHLAPNGYACGHSRQVGRMVLLHRVIMDVVNGGSEVDHISRDKLDNRRTNLRLVSRSDNTRNCVRRQGSSKFPGVFWYKRDKKWRAEIRVDGRCKSLGRFTSELDAARTYRAAALQIDPLLEFPVWDKLD